MQLENKMIFQRPKKIRVQTMLRIGPNSISLYSKTYGKGDE